jgi:hypothetical protein
MKIDNENIIINIKKKKDIYDTYFCPQWMKNYMEINDQDQLVTILSESKTPLSRSQYKFPELPKDEEN